jgi:hypothetical protein
MFRLGKGLTQFQHLLFCVDLLLSRWTAATSLRHKFRERCIDLHRMLLLEILSEGARHCIVTKPRSPLYLPLRSRCFVVFGDLGYRLCNPTEYFLSHTLAAR